MCFKLQETSYPQKNSSGIKIDVVVFQHTNMKKTLIADAGSTKVEWTLLDSDSSVAARFSVDGINALLSGSETITKALEDVSAALPGNSDIEEIFYYGAGCATPQICDKMNQALAELWKNAEIHVTTDLLGAARSLFHEKAGIACILGTGSNSCLYNGTDITMQIPSLGFVLGDEGSGAALGKRLLADAFKNQLPDSIRENFLEEYNLTLSQILDKIYKQDTPNKFLASLVPFLKANIWNPYIYSLVLEELTVFVKRNVAMYPGAHAMPLSFTGSIAFHFSNILKEAAASQGYRITTISATPMDGLIEHHRNR